MFKSARIKLTICYLLIIMIISTIENYIRNAVDAK